MTRDNFSSEAPASRSDPGDGFRATPVRSRLVWNRMQRVISYLHSSLWVAPVMAIALIYLLAPLLRMVDAHLDRSVDGLGVAGATALFQTAITLTLSFLVFTFGSMLVAIQLHAGRSGPGRLERPRAALAKASGGVCGRADAVLD